MPASSTALLNVTAIPENSILERSWQRICHQLNLQDHQILSQHTYQELLNCYQQSPRAYHTLQHLAECLKLFEQISHLAKQPALLEIALWFHDAIYHLPQPADQAGNEQQSANWAGQFLQRCGLPPRIINDVQALIMATVHHQANDPHADSLPVANVDEQLMVDIDLAILGSNPVRFAQYEQQARRNLHQALTASKKKPD